MSVQTVPDVLTGLVVAAAQAAGFGDVLDQVVEPVQPTNNPKFGDYQSNLALRINAVRRSNPRAIAEQLRSALPDHPAILKADIAGPGFLNFTLSDAWLADHLAAMTEDDTTGIAQTGAGKTLVIDYSSPNIAKRMHIGHMRSTIIGNTLLRLHQAAGWRTIADNHIGDWGTPIGKLIVAWNGWRDEAALAEDDIGELERLYVSFGERAEGDPALIEQAREETAKLQAGDPTNRALWERFMDISRRERESVYARIGATFDVTLGESFYNDALPGVVEDLLAHGIAEESKGAVVIRFSEDEEDKALRSGVLVIRKQDGAALYGTTDIATLEYRQREYDPDRIIYVTDSRQQLHCKQFFAAWQRLRAARGEASLDRPALQHMWFGMLKTDGNISSTRHGGTIRLMDLMDEAVTQARAVVEEHSPELPAEEKDAIAAAVGPNAIRYFDLSQNPTSDVNFTWEKVLSMQGSSAPFLMYAYARIRSIQRKAGVEAPTVQGIVLGHERERALAIHLLRFPAAVERALETQRPNQLCDYLFEVSGLLNSFYPVCRVIGAPEQDSRLALIEATARVLQRGLELLGIRVLDRM